MNTVSNEIQMQMVEYVRHECIVEPFLRVCICQYNADSLCSLCERFRIAEQFLGFVCGPNEDVICDRITFDYHTQRTEERIWRHTVYSVNIWSFKGKCNRSEQQFRRFVKFFELILFSICLTTILHYFDYLPLKYTRMSEFLDSLFDLFSSAEYSILKQ